MIEEGNLSQWDDIESIIEKAKEDILASRYYVILSEDETILGGFMLLMEEELTYRHIEGAWLNEKPYVTIHRIASSFLEKGILKEAVAFALSFGKDIRIDTHKNNISMRAALDSLGFVHTGVIYLNDGAPREAYQLLKKPA